MTVTTAETNKDSWIT